MTKQDIQTTDNYLFLQLLLYIAYEEITLNNLYTLLTK